MHTFREPSRSAGEHQVRQGVLTRWSNVDGGHFSLPHILDDASQGLQLLRDCPVPAAFLHHVNPVLGEADLPSNWEHSLEELGIDKETGDAGEGKGVLELKLCAVRRDECEGDSDADRRMDERDVFLKKKC